MTQTSPPGARDHAVEPESNYHRSLRILHWLMAIGFLLMWASGVFVVNVEGVPWWVENDRQGVLRDLHKSLGLTLLALLVLRAALRVVVGTPSLPTRLSASERRLAHRGHLAIYLLIVLACVTGFAIADLHEYGNAWLGIELPQIFPTRESVAGWSSTPWAYVLHAILGYGLLALVLGHVGFVHLHRSVHGIDLLPRMLGTGRGAVSRLRRPLFGGAIVTALLLGLFAVRAHVVQGPLEEPRDYLGTTPFSTRD